jgi:hypothetical protein
MALTEADARAQGRREAAPAASVIVAVFVLLAIVSRHQGWELLGLPWWGWLLLAVPGALLTIDLVLAGHGQGLVRSRRTAVVLLGVLVLCNLAGLTILVAGLVRADTSDLTGGELLLTAFAIWTANVVVFGIYFWELDSCA